MKVYNFSVGLVIFLVSVMVEVVEVVKDFNGSGLFILEILYCFKFFVVVLEEVVVLVCELF